MKNGSFAAVLPCISLTTKKKIASFCTFMSHHLSFLLHFYNIQSLQSWERNTHQKNVDWIRLGELRAIFTSNYFIIKIHQAHSESTWQTVVSLTPQVFLIPPKAFRFTAVHPSLLPGTKVQITLPTENWFKGHSIFQVFFRWVYGKLGVGTFDDHSLSMCRGVCGLKLLSQPLLFFSKS